MKSWEDIYAIFQQSPPKTLYHYTDQKGLLGILSEKEIWLTHTQYLNDSKEFHHAIELAKNEIEALRTHLSDEKGKAIVDKLLDGLDGLHIANVFVCSFSEKEDSLSQWRAYGGKNGYAIGFSGEALQGLTPAKSGFHLGKCIYDKDEQVTLMRDIVGRVVEDYKASGKSGLRAEDDNWLPNQMIPHLLRFAPLFKDHAFRAEKEWRIITMASSDHLDFRQGSGTLIPFYKKSLLNNDKVLLLDELIIGPTPYPTLALEAADNLLMREQGKLRKDPSTGENIPRIELRDRDTLADRDWVPTRLSKVPYRNW